MSRKLLVVTGRIDTMGGTEIYLQRLLAGLAGRGVQTWCLSGGNPHPGPYRHIVNPELHDGEVLRSPRAAQDLSALLRAENFHTVYVANLRCPEILEVLARHPRSLCHVHDHRYACPTGLLSETRSGRACHRPASVMCLAWCGFPVWLQHRFVPGWAKNLGGFADCSGHARRFSRVLANSRMVRDSLIANGFDSRKITVLHGFVEGRDEQPTPLPPSRFSALFVGRLEPSKGADVFLRAVSLCPDLHVSVVGSGSANEAVRRLARELGLSLRVTFTGTLSNQAALEAMRAAHVVVVPSRSPEPFGLVGIEAMSVGRAVIGSRDGGIPEWLEHEKTGLLVSPSDPQALAAALLRLRANHDELVRMGEQAWHASQAFLPEAHLDRFMEAAEL